MSIWAEGSYQDELGTTIRDTYQKKIFVPVGHIPVGIMGNINDKFLLRAEAGFKNGFYFGGSVSSTFKDRNMTALLNSRANSAIISLESKDGNG